MRTPWYHSVDEPSAPTKPQWVWRSGFGFSVQHASSSDVRLTLITALSPDMGGMWRVTVKSKQNYAAPVLQSGAFSEQLRSGPLERRFA